LRCQFIKNISMLSIIIRLLYKLWHKF